MCHCLSVHGPLICFCGFVHFGSRYLSRYLKDLRKNALRSKPISIRSRPVRTRERATRSRTARYTPAVRRTNVFARSPFSRCVVCRARCVALPVCSLSTFSNHRHPVIVTMSVSRKSVLFSLSHRLCAKFLQVRVRSRSLCMNVSSVTIVLPALAILQ